MVLATRCAAWVWPTRWKKPATPCAAPGGRARIGRARRIGGRFARAVLDAGIVSRHYGKLVFIGDSITQGWEEDGKPVWDQYYGNRKALNLGYSGDRTEHVLWRLENGNFDGLKPKAIVLMIGTNNTGHQGRPQKELNGAVYQCTAEQTAEGIKAIVAKLQQKCPDAKILILAIFPRGANKEDKFRQQNEATNAIVKGFADDKKVFFLDVGAKFLEPDGTLSKTIMPDLLHPNQEGMNLIAERFSALLATVLRDRDESGSRGAH